MDKGRTDGVFGALFTTFLYMRGSVSICSCLFQFSFFPRRVSAMKRGLESIIKYERYLYQNTPAVHYYMRYGVCFLTGDYG